MGVDHVSICSAVTSKFTRIHQNTLKIPSHYGHNTYNKCSENNGHYTLISIVTSFWFLQDLKKQLLFSSFLFFFSDSRDKY